MYEFERTISVFFRFTAWYNHLLRNSFCGLHLQVIPLNDAGVNRHPVQKLLKNDDILTVGS
jgi:hypothetical protein